MPDQNGIYVSPPRVWVEKTLVQDRLDRQDGPERLGAALWSPQTSTNDRDIYANMRAVVPGDIVLHLTDNDAITGISEIAEPVDETFRGVPNTAWGDRPCYRVSLKNFRRLEPPLRREWFFGDPEISEQLRAIVQGPKGRGLFYSGKLELNQGAYLTEAPPKLLSALDAAYVTNTGRHIVGLSQIAEAAATLETEENTAASEDGISGNRRRHWVYSPGQRAFKWDEFYETGIMALGWDDIGDFRNLGTIDDFRRALKDDNYPEKDQGQNARMCYDFVHSIKPGDVIYAKRGRGTFVGRGIVIGEYEFHPDKEEFRSVRRVRWTARGEWAWPDMLPMKTLTEWTGFPTLIEKLEALLTETAAGAISQPVILTPPSRQPFSIDDALAGLFMSREAFVGLHYTWNSKKNLILQGAPGVGKSFVARRLAYALMGFKDPTRVRTVQFHQSYGYEDFVQGYRPTEKGFSLRDGVFLTFCNRALEDPAEKYVFIIDEINRGNLSKILGELMLLIESDKRSPEWAVKLAYAEKADERFYVPENVFILGMMNTADRSLAVVDYALRRRFAFATVRPAFGETLFTEHMIKAGVAQETLNLVVQNMTALNEAISADVTNLGVGYCIGHSFFTPRDGSEEEHGLEWYRGIVQAEVLPLLEEYWFDQPDKVSQWRSRLIG